MIVRTSAKSRLMSPGTVMMSLMPCTPWRRTSSTTRNASRIARVLLDDVAQAVVGDRDERVDLGLQLLGRLLGDELAPVALERERLGHHADGQRALLLGDLGDDGRGARAGPATEPAVMNTMSESARASAILSRVLLGGALADRWVAAGAEAAR